ncbi:MAG: hypothetical protein ACPG5T_02580, partial [Endozoicomonas sp.]
MSQTITQKSAEKPEAAEGPVAEYKTTTLERQQRNHRHHIHPFADNETLAREGARIIEKAKGVYLYD